MQISSAEFLVSNTDYKQCPSTSYPEYAFIGRSNVGKSSLINLLTGRKSLALTSSKPGKTLLINHFLINGSWMIVDLPGYGFADIPVKMRDKMNRMTQSYLLHRPQLTLVFVLIDGNLPPQPRDLEFLRFLGANEIPLAIVFTKSDKSSRSKYAANLTHYREVLSEEWDPLPPIFVSSSKDASGRDELLDYIEQLNRQLSTP